jgi:phage terminase large subunit-like protein
MPKHGPKIERAAEIVLGDAWLTQYAARSRELAYFTFRPRPNRPELGDEQQAFVESRDVVAFFIAGNGSGKTEAAAAKCARFLLARQPPPRRDTPFWVLTETMHVAGEVLWKEKLLGRGHLPPSEIDWARVSWHEKKANHPRMVPLLPWPASRGGDDAKNWMIEFKSFEMGRRALQGASIGGFWFSEQFPADLFTEVLVRCRDYLFPGGQFAEFTPLDPDLCVWLERIMEEPPPGWGFYRGNTECNRENLAPGAIEAFLATTPEELKETRLRGVLASFEGAIYPSFNVKLHVVDESEVRIPPGCWHFLGTDWGSSVEHPHVTVWAAMDGAGDWIVYDELWDCDQSRTTYDLAQEVVRRCASWGWPTCVEQVEGRAVQRIMTDDPHYGMNFADPSRPGEIYSFGQYGVPTVPASNRVYDGINAVRLLLKPHPVTGRPRLRISSRCRHLIEQMRKYRWRRSRSPLSGSAINPAVASPVPLKRDDDACDALRYLIASCGMGETRPVSQPTLAPRPRRSAIWPGRPLQ